MKEKLELDPYDVNFDEQDIINALQVAFEGKIIHTQYCIQSKKLNAYLPKYKAAIEIDEYDHEGRDRKYKQMGQLMIEVHGITDIKINSDPQNHNNRLKYQNTKYTGTFLNQIKKKLKNQLKNH